MSYPAASISAFRALDSALSAAAFAPSAISLASAVSARASWVLKSASLSAYMRDIIVDALFIRDRDCSATAATSWRFISELNQPRGLLSRLSLASICSSCLDAEI